MLEEAGHAIVTAGAAGDGEFDETKVDREIIVNGHDFGRLYFVEPRERTDCPATVVHERQRLDEPARAPCPGIPARDFRRKLRRLLPGEAVLFGESVEHHPTEIVAGGDGFAAPRARAGEKGGGK